MGSLPGKRYGFLTRAFGLTALFAATAALTWLVLVRHRSPAPLPSPAPPADVVTLGNGLRVIITSPPSGGGDGFALCLRVGSRDDPEDAPGMAHLAEHVLLSRHRAGAPEHQRQLADLKSWGFNATTDRDHMCFYSPLPPGVLDAALSAQASLLAGTFSDVTAADLTDAETEIANEASRIRSNADADVDEALRQVGFGLQHPYSHPPIGDDRLARVSLSRLKEWGRRNLTATDGVLTIVTDGSRQAATTTASQLFSAIPGTARAGEWAEWIPNDAGFREYRVAHGGPEEVVLVWTVPGSVAPEARTLDVVQQLLRARLAALSDTYMVGGTDVAIRANELCSLFLITLHIGWARQSAAVDAVFRQIEELGRDGASRAELTAAAAAVTEGFENALDGAPTDRALLLARHPALVMAPSDSASAARAVTRDQVSAAVVRWLSRERAGLVRIARAGNEDVSRPRVDAAQDIDTAKPDADFAEQRVQESRDGTLKIETAASGARSYAGIAWSRDVGRGGREDLLDAMTADILQTVAARAGKAVPQRGASTGGPDRILVDNTSAWFSIGFAADADGVRDDIARLGWTLSAANWPSDAIESLIAKWRTRLSSGQPTSWSALGVRLLQVALFGNAASLTAAPSGRTVPDIGEIRTWYADRLRRGATLSVAGNSASLSDASHLSSLVAADGGRMATRESRFATPKSRASNATFGLTVPTLLDRIVVVTGIALSESDDRLGEAAAHVIDARLRRTDRSAVGGAELPVHHWTWNEGTLVYATAQVRRDAAAAAAQLIRRAWQQPWTATDCGIVRDAPHSVLGAWRFDRGMMTIAAPVEPDCSSVSKWLEQALRRGHSAAILIGARVGNDGLAPVRSIKTPWWAPVY